LRGVADLAGDVGGIDVHLGRDASNVQTGATEGALFHDGDRLVVEFRTRNRVAGTGADDDEVIVLGLSHGNVDSWNLRVGDLRVGGTGRVKQGANSHGRVSLP